MIIATIRRRWHCEIGSSPALVAILLTIIIWGGAGLALSKI